MSHGPTGGVEQVLAALVQGQVPHATLALDDATPAMEADLGWGKRKGLEFLLGALKKQLALILVGAVLNWWRANKHRSLEEVAEQFLKISKGA
jgi:hypothetical protein